MIHEQGRGIEKRKAAIFIPDFATALNEYRKRCNKKIKPFIDERHFNVICDAMEHNKKLNIVYRKQRDYHLLIGQVHYLDHLRNEIRVVDRFKEVHILKAEELIYVRKN